jgi:hypothetical protein
VRFQGRRKGVWLRRGNVARGTRHCRRVANADIKNTLRFIFLFVAFVRLITRVIRLRCG